MQKIIGKNWLSVAVAVLLVVAPLNLFWQIPLGSAYVNGLRIDYLIPKLYLSWLLVLIVTGLNLQTKLRMPSKQEIKSWVMTNWLSLCFGMIMLGRQVLTEHPESSIMHFIWLLTVILTMRVFSSIKHLKSKVALGSGIALCLQLVVGWWQLIQQRSLVAYHWLGETNLSNWFGIAKGEWFGREITLPYGTTAHPNILANTLVIGWWFTWLAVKDLLRKPTKSIVEKLIIAFWIVCSLLCSGLVISTQSITGILAAFLAISFMIASLFKLTVKRGAWKIVSWLSIIFIMALPFLMSLLQTTDLELTKHLSWTRRMDLFSHTLTIIRQDPVWGTGLSQSTIYSSRVGGTSEIVRFVQPVHNVFWLLFVETGIIGVLGVLMLLRHQLSKLPPSVSIDSLAWVLLIPAAALDHFWFSQWPGILLVSILLSLSRTNKIRVE